MGKTRFVGGMLLLTGVLLPIPIGRSAGLPSALAQTGDPVIAAAGDIACDPADPDFGKPPGSGANCRQVETSDLLVDAGLAAVLPLGDLQYPCANGDLFNQSYDPSWGRIKAISRPVAGNHEYFIPPTPPCDGLATDYFNYFGAAAGDPAKGYYSYDVGSWHIVALNSNCGEVGGCGPAHPRSSG